MSEIWNFILHSNIINFLIVLYFLVWLFKKIDIKQKIGHIRNEIKNFVENSELEKEEAQKKLNEINDKISVLPKEISEIENSTENSVKSICEKIKIEIEEQKQDLANNAERIFNLETKKFKQKLTSILTEKSIEIARDNALKQLENNTELHNKYIENAIDELDRIIL